ncbi:MAG: redox-regulated ATPase YchF [Candidatus Sungbacteria bacterium]|uniref:Ribosome-binding ATPase YchF n=1 Tax=Candidatus Sungiibacteriota bacterium TaxID=2750080 RepID=A0A932QXQ5_9BACT|nr:redox-regulated ATPase YchF [Candidatus Sungbacteria bacterium]
MLKIGIVGLPNVGKSTLFSALTRKKVDTSNYPFCTIEPNVGVVEVPDARLTALADLSRSRKIIPAIVEFVDIAGLVKGAAQGEGLGNKFLSHIRDVDAIAEVVRVFEDPEITHVAGPLDPVSDIEILEYELILKDLESVTKRMETLQHDIRARKKGAEEEQADLKAIQAHLSSGRLLKGGFKNASRDLLTAKTIIYICNVSETQLQNHWQPEHALQAKIDGSPWIPVCAKTESELSELQDAEKAEYLGALGIAESGLDQLIRTGYAALDLITFFTTGEDETRAWTIPKGSSAPRAGRAIHSDFEEKFIRAQVIGCDKLLEAGSYERARELGWLRTEGKEYIVQDGDVIEFKI